MSRIRTIWALWPLSVLLLIASVKAAFTTSHCDSDKQCVQKTTNGIWCFSTQYTSRIGSCSSPWALPLQTHLNQNLSIGYYSPNGQFLGGSDYHVVFGPSSTYVCMSARVDLSQSATLCAVAPTDNTWYLDQYCFVNVVPSAKDGCLDGSPPLSTGSASTTGNANITGSLSPSIAVNPTQTATPTASNVLKDSHYVLVWGPIVVVMLSGIIYAITKRYVPERGTPDAPIPMTPLARS